MEMPQWDRVRICDQVVYDAGQGETLHVITVEFDHSNMEMVSLSKTF